MNKKLFLGIVLFLGLILLGVVHEEIHKQIYKSYSIDGYIDYFNVNDGFPKFTFFPDNKCPSDGCRLANNINEVVGYYLMVIYLFFSLLIIKLFGDDDA